MNTKKGLATVVDVPINIYNYIAILDILSNNKVKKKLRSHIGDLSHVDILCTPRSRRRNNKTYIQFNIQCRACHGVVEYNSYKHTDIGKL